jgi:hypothetical protein
LSTYKVFTGKMPVPISASAALKMQSPRKNFGAAANTVPVSNRLMSIVRDASPAPASDGRPRSNSVKRKEPEGPSFASVASKNLANSPCYDEDVTGDLTLNVVKVRSLLDKAAGEINDLVVDPGVVTVLNTMCEAMREICTVQDKLVTGKIQSGKESAYANRGNMMVNLGAISKRPRNDPDVAVRAAKDPAENANTVSGTGGGSTASGTEDTDPVKNKFREAIKEAEKSTLVFNLNLGRIPIMNLETMNKRATLALTALAATKEKKSGSAPCNDTVEAIDDALSVAENVMFFGRGTKTYKNTKDPLSGSYCTAPVKYDFKNKDVRFAAEKVLRSKCGVNCSVPYPTMVRECIKQIVNEVKKVHPDNFVRVNVDTNKYVFKIARMPPKGAPDPGWKYDIKEVPIPTEAMDVWTRQVPKDFKVEVFWIKASVLPQNNNNEPVGDISDEMSVTEANG